MTRFLFAVTVFLFIITSPAFARVTDDYARDIKGKKNIQTLETNIDVLADRLLQTVRDHVNQPDCLVPIIYPGERSWITSCGGVSIPEAGLTTVGQAALYTGKLQINKKAVKTPAWPVHYARWVQTITEKVPHLKRREFSGYYLPITFRNDTNIFDHKRSRQRGMELLLPDARTLLVFTFTDEPDYDKKQWRSLIRLAMIDVRALPPEFWAVTYREAEIYDYTSEEYQVVGRTANSEEWNEIRNWSKDMNMTRPLSGDILLPDYPRPSEDIIELGIALAELRWQRLEDHVDDIRVITTRAQTEQSKIRQQQAREFRQAIARQNASHGNSRENTPAFAEAANAILDMARRENELASIRNNVMRQRILYDANARAANNHRSGHSHQQDATHRPPSNNNQTGTVLARTNTQTGVAESSCRTKKYPSNSPTNNNACYQSNRNFTPGQGHYCEGGYSRHYSDNACDFEIIKAELTQAAQQKHSGTTRRTTDPQFFQSARAVKDKLCAGDYRENQEYDVTTYFAGATCEEAQVTIGQRTWPGVNCIAEVDYSCSINTPIHTEGSSPR